MNSHSGRLALPSTLARRALELATRVRPEERRSALGAFLTLFGFMAGHTLLETARDSLFLASLSARRLPWVYLLIAGVALLLTTRQQYLTRRIPARHELTAWLLLAGMGTLAFWVGTLLAGSWIFYALYVWSGVLATLVIVRFWTLLGNLFTVTQAKRIYALVGAGSVAGAIAGSAAALVLAEFLTAQYLVLAAAIVFFAAASAPRLLPTPAVDTPDGHLERLGDVARAARAAWVQPYLRRVAGLILLATITFTLVDFVFKSAADRYVTPDGLEEFFSSVYLGLNIASLVVQLFLVPYLIRWLGVNGAIAVVPGLILLSAVGLAAGGGLALVLVLKSSDGALRHSLYRTGVEVLFFPVSADARARLKSVVDVIGQRGGQALGSILILMVLSVSAGESVFAVLTAIAALAWLALAIAIRSHYLRAFRDQLREDTVSDQVRIPALDLASLETLLATLNDPNESRVLAALDVLSLQGKTDVIPALILYHPSASVVEKSLDVLAAAGREDLLNFLDRMETHGHSGVRCGAIRARSTLRPDRAKLEEALADPDASVRATAATVLTALGWREPESLAGEVGEYLDSDEWEPARAAARAALAVPSQALESALCALVEAPEDGVARDALRAMRQVRSPRFLSVLLPLLRRHALRAEVGETVLSLGPGVLPRLAEDLGNEELDPAVRKHLARTIAAYRTAGAADALVRRLSLETDGQLRYQILRALGRWRADQPALPLERSVLDRALEQNIRLSLRLLDWRRALESATNLEPEDDTPLHRALCDLIRDKQGHALERAFRLLNLIQNDDDFRRIYVGFQSPSAISRASSRELVELLVLPPLREPLLRLVDDLFEKKASPAADEGSDLFSRPVPAYTVVLDELTAADIPSLAAFAKARLAELDEGPEGTAQRTPGAPRGRDGVADDPRAAS